MPRKKGQYKGWKICEGCRKLHEKEEIRFYEKADQHLCKKCYKTWEDTHYEAL